MKKFPLNAILLLAGFLTPSVCCSGQRETPKAPVDYVNPYMGNISHILVPTYPTVHLPNSMLRIYPERADYTADLIRGLPVMLTAHRGASTFAISPANAGSILSPVMYFQYDREKITPYSYEVRLDEMQVEVRFAPSHQSAVYEFNFETDGDHLLILNTKDGEINLTDEGITASQSIRGETVQVYAFFETAEKAVESGALEDGEINPAVKTVKGKDKAVALNFGKRKTVRLRYGVSFIDFRQARQNLRREIHDYDCRATARKAREIWNGTLGKIQVEGGSENDRAVFYTSLYRTYERMIGISEDGRYFSAYGGGKVYSDSGRKFYTDDWIWDTYRAAHPLRALIEPEMEQDMIHSYILMAQQADDGWMPTFPEIEGDSHCMNGNHAVATVLDAYAKGLRNFDLEAAYKACRSSITEKSLLPWRKVPNTEIDVFYHEKGYYPALKRGETEYIKETSSWEKRQPVAVTLGASYDHWCLSQIAKALGKTDDYARFLKSSYNYRNLYNPETGFFHPKDLDGNFIQPFDYTFDGGPGAREYYDENNGWTYRWDVPHNPADLIALMGSPEIFVGNMNRTFREPLGKSKNDFYALLPDQTGNVGQFSMANEPSLHIPYLYNYAGQPWMTQKRVRQLLATWFRNDLMGVPGDEDGGGMSAFAVFSSMGFYPVTPGMPVYNIGSPVFSRVKINLGNGKFFEIEAVNCSAENKYIQSATLNGKVWNRPWFEHKDIAAGGKLILVMGDKANKSWGSRPEDAPPSAEKTD